MFIQYFAKQVILEVIGWRFEAKGGYCLIGENFAPGLPDFE